MIPAAQHKASGSQGPGLWEPAWSAGRFPSGAAGAPAALLHQVGRLDAELLAHGQRVASLCQRLGVRLGLGVADLADLRLAAELHDIGKLDLPTTAHHRAGPLRASERAVVRAHAVLGERRVRATLQVSPAVLGAIRHHHEHWNGEGYPDGLRGRQIPLLARIVAVCDVYDALRSARSYKPAWTRQETCAELRRCAGRQFEAGLVHALLSMLDEG
ncbi:HD-GYP domain-containing protein [Deinococcus navajonensis]|uniref:HD-GYP domain-containing protein n=1 Tax=Deinococcus navajonensis TaxID=309884 RepID=A0ABV8XPR1_9DEIO